MKFSSIGSLLLLLTICFSGYVLGEDLNSEMRPLELSANLGEPVRREKRAYGYGGYNPYPVATPLGPLDKLNKQLDDLKCQLNTAEEEASQQESQLSLLVKACIEFEEILVPHLEAQDKNDMVHINELMIHLANLSSAVDELSTDIGNTAEKNQMNINDSRDVADSVNEREAINQAQDGAFAKLEENVKGFKDKLLQVLDNEIELHDDGVERTQRDLTLAQASEAKRTCESGVVTLDSADRRGEYFFQEKFEWAPQVWYGLSKQNFGIDKKSSQGYFHPSQSTPSSLGALVYARASTVGLTFERFNLAFGDGSTQKLSISFLACTIAVGDLKQDPTEPETTTAPETTTTPVPQNGADHAAR